MRTPKYLKIKEDLLKEINSGKFVSGDKFYSEKELIEKYSVSSITVIRAIQELTTEGYLIRIQGKGTYISRSRKRKLVEFSDIELFPSKNDKVQVLEITPEHNQEILNKLNLKADQTYYRITRLRCDKDTPYFLQNTYLPEKYINKNKINDLNYFQSVYHRLKKDFNLNMLDQDSTEINEIAMTPPKLVNALLELPENTPVVKQEKITCLQESDEVIELVQSYKKLEYFKIEFSNVHL
ncbi:GntR family transcriptional regulator [Vagococcus zengguangii]|uniref:GntR family transcriptional regulator n=1 Tax=Vagococcus zengguangii TaxID=2571750 RepID=A0A4D7CNQ6_9ENTE|nr:GntR family transcriptional regulator [Vagococcus zengguangii]QCI85715.1 GntR family transcriptional regulator [Vagococcus zengguangii]TLG81656.1 GntR family transcriptional regulator [Vagococcus zengguangii]